MKNELLLKYQVTFKKFNSGKKIEMKEILNRVENHLFEFKQEMPSSDANWINELSRQSRNITYDRMEVVEASIDDFDFEKIDFYQRRKNEKLGTPIEKVTPEYLEKADFLKRFNGRRVPTVGGLLFMGKNPQQATSLPRAVIKCARFKGKEKGIFIDQTVIEGSLFEQIDEFKVTLYGPGENFMKDVENNRVK